ncbi:hypothetical protein ACJJTC_011170 [Scirpophaga incertulas]
MENYDYSYKNMIEENQTSRRPRKIMKVNPSKFEMGEAIHRNKRYWKGVFHELDAMADEAEAKSKQLAKVLPKYLYIKVCKTLGIPIINDAETVPENNKEIPVKRIHKEPLLSYRKKLSIDRLADSDTDVELDPSDNEEDAMTNIHQEFLSKPEREQVTWPTHYLQPEREEDKSLIRKADDLTDRIATEFCKYMKELGGDQQSQLFKPHSIKELFQIEFDTHMSRGLRVISKEIPCVDDKIAAVTGYPEKSRTAALEREISRDIAAEHRPNKLRAFGRRLSLQDRWVAPHNETKRLWRSARHVPKDLVTLKTVWEGITNLRSVKEYCRWMIDHPEYRRAPYLSSLGMFDPAVLEARLTFEAEYEVACGLQEKNTCKPSNDIHKRLSELTDNK